MLHAAVRSVAGAPSSDASGSHPHTPQVVENTVAGDLMVAQVGLDMLLHGSARGPKTVDQSP
jgi:hypothetical protein